MQENGMDCCVEELEAKEEPFIKSPPNVRSNLILNDQSNIVDNSNIDSPLSEWSDWSYDPKTLALNETATDDKHVDKICSSSIHINVPDNFIKLSQMSVWSDWSYHPNSPIAEDNSKVNRSDNVRDPHYKFLPISIYKILPYKHLKILGDRDKLRATVCSPNNMLDNSSLKDMIEDTHKCFENMMNLAVCNVKRKFEECRITGNIINSLQVNLIIFKLI